DMETPLRLLLLDDSPEDQKAIEGALKEAGLEVQLTAASTREALIQALGEPVDILLAEPSLPDLSFRLVLSLLKERALTAALILCARGPKEEEAKEALLAGARDYLRKDQLSWLAPVLFRERKVLEGERQRLMLSDALYFQRALLSSQSEASHDGILVVSKSG